MLLNITNDFHRTAARVTEGTKTPATARRIERKLCGVSGCTCGGPLGTRGRQEEGAVFAADAYGAVEVVAIANLRGDG